VRVRLVAGAVALAALLAVLALAALGVNSPPSAVQLLVTRDFGSRVLHRSGALKAQEHETVLSLLSGAEPVTTASAGGAVASIAGLPRARLPASASAWSFYVNGVRAPEVAARTSVHPGDHVWWDLHESGPGGDVPAVVGSFPEPFVNGVEGERLPVRIECSPSAGVACAAVTARLRALNVPAAISAIGSGGAPETLRVMVGPWDQLESAMAQSLERGLSSSGVYARFAEGGHTLALLDQDGREAQLLHAGSGLIAATRQSKEAPVWVVTGTDLAGVNLAARALDRATLQDRFAVAFGPSAIVSLPDLSKERSGTL
jgi:hypothetical protein